ncbi:hypothetical protein [Spirosoma sp.]|uniref:hypothetical protein n=1 Tax=Spirosoma sp. TaxID=1899569 RepID=UPI003B3BA260
MKKETNLLLLFGLFQSCTSIVDCENELIFTQKNSDNTKHLFVFTRDCGATTSKSIHFSLLNRGVILDDSYGGNIFVANGKPTLESYKEAISTKWIDKKVLEIQYDKSLRVFKRDTVWGDVQIRYLPR